jgi:hypothetical protein
VGAAAAVIALTLILPGVALAEVTYEGAEGQSVSVKVGTWPEGVVGETGLEDSCVVREYEPIHHLKKQTCNTYTLSGKVHWGDSSESAAEFPTEGTCSGNEYECKILAKGGSHVYASANHYSGSVSWTCEDLRIERTGTISISHPPCAGGTIAFAAKIADVKIEVVPNSFNISRAGRTATVTASITDEGHEGAAGYLAEIHWGDKRLGSENGEYEGHTFASITVGSEGLSVTGSYEYEAGHLPKEEIKLIVYDIGGTEAPEASGPFPGGQPIPVTVGANQITQETATLQGEVHQTAGVTECYFKWGTTESYGKEAKCSQAVGAAGPIVSAPIGGLTAGTEYHVRLVVGSAGERFEGKDVSFKTLQALAPGAPTVVTGAAGGVTQSGAVLHAEVNPHGPTVADCHFEWGTDATYGHSAPCNPASPTGGGSVSVNATLSGLSPGTTYHFRVVASNPGSAASDGADESFPTLPSCEVEVTFGYVGAKGCFRPVGGAYMSTPGTNVSLDGLTLAPDQSATTIIVDPRNHTVTSSAAVKVSASEVQLSDGTLSWTEPTTDGIDPVKLGALTPPTGAGVGSLGFAGKLSLAFNHNKGADLAGNVELPFGKITSYLGSALGINGTVELHAALGVGLLHDQITIKKESLELGGVQVKHLKVVYSPTDDLWEGGAEVILPTPNNISISAALALEHGKFHKFEGSVGNLNVPLVDGVYLQRIAVVFGVEPTTFGGGLGLSFGPEVKGTALVGVEGNFLYRAPIGLEPGHFHVDGDVTLVGIKAVTGYFDYFTSGLVRFGVQAQFGFPNTLAKEPKKQPVYIEGSLNGAVYQGKFDVLAKVQVDLNFIEVNLGGEVLVSDKGLAGCAHLSSFGFSWSPGFGYTWATQELDLMWHRCSVSPWQTLELGPIASAVGTGRKITLAGGGAVLGLTGSTGAPQVTLTGPHGQTVSVPTTSTRPLMIRGFMIFQDPKDKITYVAVQHSAGTWHLTPEAGSPAVVSIRRAGILPEPSIRAHVAVRGRLHTLSWRLHPIPGQRVVFWEKGHDSGQVIGATSASTGILHFTPANGSGGRRSIVAQILSYGLPRNDIVVASYIAPPPARPGRPGHLKVVSAAGGAVRVSWRAAPHAQRYIVEVDTGDGAHLVELTKNRATSIVVHDVVPITTATVTVMGELSTGVKGASAKATLTPKPHKKRHKHRSTHK